MTTVLIGIYIACELIANITAAKPVEFFGLVAPGGVLIYALTFTILDLLHERLGHRGVRTVVYTAFIANALLAGYIALVAAIPAPGFYANQDAFVAVLGATPRIVAASLTAYLISALLDVEVYARLRERFAHSAWSRVLISNTASTAVDSAVFVVIAFAGVMPVLPLILGQYIIKMTVTVLSLPLAHAARIAERATTDA
jgi:queuosine precursor transporter